MQIQIPTYKPKRKKCPKGNLKREKCPKGNLKREKCLKGNLKAKTGNLGEREFKISALDGELNAKKALKIPKSYAKIDIKDI